MAEAAFTPAPQPAAAPPERRLHPLSWLFVLLQQLQQFVVPLLALVLFGRGDRNALWPLIGVGVLVVTSIVHSLTYRYRIEADSLVVRSGLLQRSLRQIPFARIHNVAVHQSLLHRLFGVAEVRLESAGGRKPEAQMRVLTLAEALALEAIVRRRAAPAPAMAAAGDGAAGPADAGRRLLQLPVGEVLRLGFVSNRGMIVVGGAIAALTQLSPGLATDLARQWAKAAFGWAGHQHLDGVALVLVGASLVLGFVVLLRVLSMALALLQYFGFRLEAHGRRLTVERGLLTRTRTSMPRRRIQAWTLREGLLQRWLHRRSLHVDSAVGEEPGQARALRELAPIATPAHCDALVHALLPQAAWPPADWRPLHPAAWRRLALPGVVLSLVATAALSWRFGAWGMLALAWLPWAVFSARRHAQRAGYAIDHALVAVREGWWSRSWRFAEIGKLQALRLTHSPLDRWHGMATLWLDTAGAGALAPPLRLRYLPEAEARTACARPAAALARQPMHW